MGFEGARRLVARARSERLNLFLFTVFIWTQLPRVVGLYYEERVEMTSSAGHHEIVTKRVWVGKDRIRTDLVEDELSLIYDLDLHIIYVMDHRARSYVVSRSKTRKEARLCLTGLAPILDGVLQRNPPYVTATGRQRKFGRWRCSEYRLNYAESFGVETRIWASSQLNHLKSQFRKTWYAALGTAPPSDVRYVLNDVLREIGGIPIQISATLSLEGHFVKTTATITELRALTDVDPSILSVPQDYRIDWDLQ